ncbi:MAG: peptidylprolyl isomerase [Intestinibacillus sp.]
MKKKLVPIIAMIVITAICIGLVIAAHPAPKYEIQDNGTPVVMTVNGEEIHASEYASMMIYSKAYMDNMMQMYGMDSSVWDDPETRDQFLSQLQEQTKQQVVYIHTILDQFQKSGLKLTRDQITKMEDQKAQLVEQQGGEALFTVWLATLGFNEQMYDNILLISTYAEALNDYYFGANGKALPAQDKMLEYYKSNYIQAKHILIQTTDDQGNELTGDELAKKTALAEDIASQVKSGKDFDELAKQYNEDPGASQYPDGYIFTEGDMVDEFYQAASKLGENEISGVVKSSYGYHIIKRVPLDETKMSDYATAIASGIAGKEVSFDAMVQEWMDAAKVETTEEFSKITLDNVFEYISTGTDTESGDGSAPATNDGAGADTSESAGADANTDASPSSDAGNAVTNNAAAAG